MVFELNKDGASVCPGQYGLLSKNSARICLQCQNTCLVHRTAPVIWWAQAERELESHSYLWASGLCRMWVS